MDQLPTRNQKSHKTPRNKTTKLITHYGRQGNETNLQLRHPPQNHTEEKIMQYKKIEPVNCNGKCDTHSGRQTKNNSYHKCQRILQKGQTFLKDNNFHLIQKDPTIKYQNLIQKTLQQCILLVNKKKITHLIQKKPLPPTLKAQLKLHKPDIPIRPVINNMNVPTYKVAKHIVKLLNRHLTLKINTMLKTAQTCPPI